jgi:hypothetical protein
LNRVRVGENIPLMKRRWVVVLALLALVVIPATVWALSSGRYDGKLDRQRAKFRTDSITTSSTTWQDVPVLSVNICSLNEVSATLSVNLSGARAGFRIVGEQGNVAEPGAIAFIPSGGVESFSYTFVTSTGTFEADDRHTLTVQWRSSTGAPVTLGRGDLNVLYQRGSFC